MKILIPSGRLGSYECQLLVLLSRSCGSVQTFRAEMRFVCLFRRDEITNPVIGDGINAESNWDLQIGDTQLRIVIVVCEINFSN